MQDIQREAGLSPGLTYLYFASKDDIIAAVADERHAREWALIEQARAQGDGLSALRVLAQGFFGALEAPEERTSRRVGVQVWAEALRNPRILELVRRGVDEPRALLTDLLREAQERHELTASANPDALARVLIALFQGFVLQQAWDDEADAASYVAAIEAAVGTLFGVGSQQES
jgi:AcrR family transcriptional regulator